MRNFYYLILSIFSGIIRKIFKRNLRVLAYHGIHDRIAFAKQIEYLKSNYNIIDISDVQEYIQKPSGKLPHYPLLLTFDDGDRSFIENGFPILKQSKTPGCIFIITSLIDTNNNFWWEVLAEKEKKEGKSFSEIRKKINFLKRVSNSERLNILKSYPPVPKDQLSSRDLMFMRANGISIGNHTHSHPMLDNCTEKEIQAELASSKLLFKKWNIAGFEIFAYPNGNRDQRTEDLLKKNGVKLAFLFDHKINSTKLSPLQISRIRTNADMPIPELKAKVSGLHSLISKYRLVVW